ncbi:hypothetical protein B0A52_00497 [Exophiala mesophila]|uniref:Uncharacterized protein n=1 Tax=Exophiala mesophila TaxID=212818 RepID=A0A438NK68_EXOME|nr:hypothetical protein B0A52_00497 [Exophiala mesophila]
MSEFPVHNSPCSKRILIRGRCESRRSNRSAWPSSPAETAVHVEDDKKHTSHPDEDETLSNGMSNNLVIESPPVDQEEQGTAIDSVLDSECHEKLIHPMHTISLEKQCNVCIEDRETRLQAFWQRTQQDMNDRLNSRISSMASNVSGWQGRRFRATGGSTSPSLLSRSRSSTNTAVSDLSADSPAVKVTVAAPETPRRNSTVESEASISTIASPASSAAVGNFMRGVVGWKSSDSVDGGSSLFSSPKTNRLSWFGTPISPKSRTPVGQIPAVKVVDLDEVASPGQRGCRGLCCLLVDSTLEAKGSVRIDRIR